MNDLKNDLEQTLISEGTKAMMLKLAEESYRQGVNDTLQSAKEAAEKAFVLGIEKALAAEREALESENKTLKDEIKELENELFELRMNNPY
jgi:cell division protein FtsB